MAQRNTSLQRILWSCCLGDQILNQRSVRSPAAVGFNGGVFYFWTGTNKDRNLNVQRIK